MSGIVLSAQERLSLALYIGQVKTPSFVVGNGDAALQMKVRAGAPAVLDLYPLLRADGGTDDNLTGGAAKDTGGLVLSTPTNGTATASQRGATTAMHYDLTYTYTRTADLVEDDSFRVEVVSAAAVPTSESRSVAVKVYGVTSGASALAVAKGQTYGAGAPVYKIASNDPNATFSASLVSPAESLGLIGLSVDGSGNIVGTVTAAPGDYTLRVRANISGSTVGVANAGPVDRDVSLTVAGITSAASVQYRQGFTITDYQISAFPAVPTAFEVADPLPTGLQFDAASGRVFGTPTVSGTFNVTVRAKTGTGDPVSQVLQINISAAAAPTAIGSNLPASPVAAGTVGTPIDGSNYRISATSTPPVTAYSADGLDALNLAVDPVSGLITGTPSASGDFLLTLRARNVGGAGTPVTTTIRINPNTAPVVSATNPPASKVNAEFNATTPFFVTASNGPISSFALAPGSVLPPDLALNPATGAITGVPRSSGTFRAGFVATNVVNLTSVAQELTFTIDPTAVPVIAPLSAAVLAGVEIAPIQVVASNPTVTKYFKAGAWPPGLELDEAKGIISGIPLSPGVFKPTLSAQNAAGTGPLLEVTITVGIPAPSACAMSVPLNTPTTLDLASCLFAGFVPTGVNVVATPAHGTVLASGTKVTYTPVNNYFGTDAFTFVGFGAGLTSPQGTVTVTVTGRPDPAQDPVVSGLLAAQTETAQRFSRAQISNFQRRMESLHRGPVDSAAQAQAGALQGGLVGAAPGGNAWSGQAGSLAPGRGSAFDMGTPGAITTLAANHAPTAASRSEVIGALAAGAGIQSLPFAQSMLSLVKDRSVNLAGVASGMGINSAAASPSGTNFWIEGVATFGTRDASGTMTGSDFSSSGVTVGVDRRYSEQLALGMGLGYARDKTLIGTDGSQNRAKGYSLAVYGSYQPSRSTYLDGLLGIGSLDFDTTRFVAPIGDYALGRRSGTQLFGSLTGGWEYRKLNTLVSPYGRIDFATDRLNTATESGAGAYALTYFGQTTTSVQGALGVRGESVHATGFGYAVPRLRAELRHDFSGRGDAFIGYADQIGGPRYRLASAGAARNSLVLGIGSDFLMRDGLTLAFEYQLSHSFSNASTHALRLRLSKDFDVRGLPNLLSEDPEAAHDEPIDVQVEAGTVRDDNVTRAKRGPNKFGDNLYTLNVSKTFVHPLTEQSRLLATATVGGEKFRRYNGLSRLQGGGELEYQYRGSSEFDAPTFGASAKFSAEDYESRLRDGYRMSVGVSYRQPLTDRINLFAALSRNLRTADSAVFSTQDTSLRGNVDYALSDNAILYLGADYRRGDIVSTGRPSLENVTIADVFVQDDAFPGGQLYSYRFRGDTVLTTVGYNLGLGPRDSIDLSWRRVRSTPGLRPGFVTSERSYKANQFSAVYLLRF